MATKPGTVPFRTSRTSTPVKGTTGKVGKTITPPAPPSGKPR